MKRLMGALRRWMGRPDKTAAAVDVIARKVIYQLFNPDTVGELWSDYPEIGEDDWEDVIELVRKKAQHAAPDDETYRHAYAHLQARSEAWTAEHGEVV